MLTPDQLDEAYDQLDPERCDLGTCNYGPCRDYTSHYPQLALRDALAGAR